MTPRVLIFAPAYAPACFSEGLVNSKLALAMVESGWDVVTVSNSGAQEMSYTKGWPALWAPLRPTRREAAAAPGSGLGRVVTLLGDIVRTGHCIRGVHWGVTACEVALAEHQRRPFDLMLSRSTSCVAHLPALLFKRLTGVCWIANWNDPPPYLFPKPYYSPMSRTSRAGNRRYFRAVTAAADYNTFPSARLAAYLRDELGVHENAKVRVVPHIGLVERFMPVHSGFGEVLRFCHAGNLSQERNPALFLQAFKRVAERHRSAGLRMECEIIGVEAHGLGEAIRRLGLEGIVSFSGAKSYEESMAIIKGCAVAVLIEAPCQEGVFLPSKIIDYAQAGKPVLAVSPVVGVMSDLLADGKAGIRADIGSEESVEQALERFVAEWRGDRLGSFNMDAIWRPAAPEAVLVQLCGMMNEVRHKIGSNGYNFELH